MLIIQVSGDVDVHTGHAMLLNYGQQFLCDGAIKSFAKVNEVHIDGVIQFQYCSRMFLIVNMCSTVPLPCLTPAFSALAGRSISSTP